MELYLKQHIFSWGDKFTVYNPDGSDRYHVRGEVFSLGKKLHIYDLLGGEIAFIQQKLLTFLPKYYIAVNGNNIAEVVKQFTFLRHEYTVNGLGWRVEGDFWAHEYTVMNGDDVIASVSKQWFTLGDAYEVSIANDADELNALCVVLAIDACMAAANSSSN